MKRVFEYWRARSLSEQRMLAGGSIFLLALLLGLYVIAPMNKERARVRAALPQLRLEAAALNAAAIEATRLKPLAGSLAPVQDMRKALRESATAMQIDVSALVIEQDTPGRARITFNRVSFDRFAAWIDALQRNHKLRLGAASIRALPETGMVAVEAELLSPASS